VQVVGILYRLGIGIPGLLLLAVEVYDVHV